MSLSFTKKPRGLLFEKLLFSKSLRRELEGARWQDKRAVTSDWRRVRSRLYKRGRPWQPIILQSQVYMNS